VIAFCNFFLCYAGSLEHFRLYGLTTFIFSFCCSAAFDAETFHRYVFSVLHSYQATCQLLSSSPVLSCCSLNLLSVLNLFRTSFNSFVIASCFDFHFSCLVYKYLISCKSFISYEYISSNLFILGTGVTLFMCANHSLSIFSL
jgi:hypothetical protein